MKFPRPVALVLALGLIATVAIVAACNNGSNNNVVNPPVRELDSGTLGLNGVYAHTFANAGTFGYHCTIHGAAVMSGSVTVAAGQPATAAVTIGPGNSYSPPTISVAPGGSVTWTNSPTGSAHTVTSN